MVPVFDRALPLKAKKESPSDSSLPGSTSAPRMTLTVEEMADELHLSRPMAYELVKDPGFPSFRIGKRILVNRQGLQRWIDAQSDRSLPVAVDGSI